MVDFRNTIILMTSNVGAQTASQPNIGFTPSSEEGDYETMKGKILEEAKRAFKPEFLNRLDDVIVFRSLSKLDLITILDLEITKVMDRLKHKQIDLHLTDGAKDFLVDKGFDPAYGARPMRRAVERYLEDPLAEEILKGTFQEQTPIQVIVEEDHLAFTQEAGKQDAKVTS